MKGIPSGGTRWSPRAGVSQVGSLARHLPLFIPGQSEGRVESDADFHSSLSAGFSGLILFCRLGSNRAFCAWDRFSQTRIDPACGRQGASEGFERALRAVVVVGAGQKSNMQAEPA